MRLAVVLALLAGCGRFEFERQPDAAPLLDGTSDTDSGILDLFGPCIEGDARVERDGICYSRFDGPVNYFEAKATCASIGGHLITVADDREAEILPMLVTADAWIGLEDRITEGAYTWITGEPLTYTRWAAGEPNNEEGEDCAEAYSNAEWNDESCGSVQAFLCERRIAPLPCVEGDLRAERDGRCYFAIAGNVPHAAAVSRCAESEAHLATITSAEENELVVSLVVNYAWIGLGDEPEEGAYEWVTGEPVAYTAWREDEPNNDGEEDCTQIVFGGWNDEACATMMADMVCERP